MNKNIQTILDMLESNTFQKGVLLDILKSYGEDIALMPIKLFANQKILRTRKNEDDVFGYIHELSYPPKEYARTDRASIEGKPMFYASISLKKLKSIMHIQELSAHWKRFHYYGLKELVDKI